MTESWQVFEDKHQILQDDAPQIPYQAGTFRTMTNTAVHWGQRKLLLSLLQFFTHYVRPNPESKKTTMLVYAGAANGHGTALIARMFPSVIFHLYDTNPFSTSFEELNNVVIFNQYFTDVEAVRYRELSAENDIYFVSDIRLYGKESILEKISEEHPQFSREEVENISKDYIEEYIKKEMIMQMEWFKKIQPVAAQFKFRLPYAYKSDPNEIFRYLDGFIYFQPYVSRASSETRLVVLRGAGLIDYNLLKYEQQMYYHNINRIDSKYFNLLTGREEIQVPNELLNDYDSILEARILIDYFYSCHGRDPSPLELGQLVYMITFHLSKSLTLEKLRNSELHEASSKIVENINAVLGGPKRKRMGRAGKPEGETDVLKLAPSKFGALTTNIKAPNKNIIPQGIPIVYSRKPVQRIGVQQNPEQFRELIAANIKLDQEAQDRRAQGNKPQIYPSYEMIQQVQEQAYNNVVSQYRNLAEEQSTGGEFEFIENEESEPSEFY